VAAVEAIYVRQPPLQELIGNGWILLAVKDPESTRIDLFTPEQGFVRWQGDRRELPVVARSADWYGGHTGHLGPALVTANALPTTPAARAAGVQHA
jgi:hypothetical protein